MGKSVADGGCAIAVGGEKRINTPLPHHIVVENFIHNAADVFINIPSLDVGLVILRGRGNIKIIPLTAVKFVKYAVQRIGNLCVDIRANCGFGPCGVNLAGGHIFDIIGKRHGYVFRRLIRQPQVYRNCFGNGWNLL